MKNISIFKGLAGLLMTVVLSVGFTSCDDDSWDDYNGPGSFADRRLSGTWMLFHANGYAVPPAEANYFTFYGGGNGNYYYMENGRRYVDSIRWWCQPSVNGASVYQLNIVYASGYAETVNYWFSDSNTMFMQWTTNDGYTESYTYDRCPPGYTLW